MNRQEFLNTIETGKWFKVKGKYNQNYLVKLKKSNEDTINALWLSHSDPESMALQDYSYKRQQWDITNNQFTIYGSDTYQFGSLDPGDDSIYDDECNLLEDKMMDVILFNAPTKFLEKEELQIVWNNLKERDFNKYEELIING